MKVLFQVPKSQSLQYGCAGINPSTNEIVHYIEKPASFVSVDVNAGVYLLNRSILDDIGLLFQKRHRMRMSSLSE